jgi:hypothetical protein
MLLKRAPEFKIFLDILNRSINHISITNAICKDDTVMRWNQGRAQELLDIIKVIKNADEELHAFKSEARKHIE